MTRKRTSKIELLARVAVSTGHPLNYVSAIVDSFLQTISHDTATGIEVPLPDFGTFYVRDNRERQGRNPGTGAAVTIAASRTLAFRAAKSAKGKA